MSEVCPGCTAKDSEIKWLHEMLESRMGGRVEIPSMMEDLAEQSEEEAPEGGVSLSLVQAALKHRHETPLCSMTLPEEVTEEVPEDSAAGGVEGLAQDAEAG